ncbi:TlpA family protein disulfide reductase [Chryseobacterium gambrini]|uniref:TlpA family protein disulfide reductase n=1 Tax=Chryseobacterium gambrini TaxID=373672 RepID=UPI000970C74A|nr:thioredoxin-like domain-containing protein [Chryseobacterium gambrini]
MLKEILNNYYQAIELYEDKKKIIEHSIAANEVWLKALEKEPTKQQELAEYYFTLFEKKNLTKVSEHIALSMLNKKNCQLTNKQTNLFEQYRKLGIGKTAPNINFNQKNQGDLKDLKNLKNAYKLVVFGASWCPNCQTDYPSLIGKYKRLKKIHDLEVVYISIDTDKNTFEAYYKEAPFITFCDTKG